MNVASVNCCYKYLQVYSFSLSLLCRKACILEKCHLILECLCKTAIAERFQPTGLPSHPVTNQNSKHLTNSKTEASLPTILIAVTGRYNHVLILLHSMLNLEVQMQGFSKSGIFKVPHYQDTNHYSKISACLAVHLNYRDIQCPRLLWAPYDLTVLRLWFPLPVDFNEGSILHS